MATFADFESIYSKYRYIEIFDIEVEDTIRYLDIEMIYQYFRYIDPSLITISQQGIDQS